MDVKLPKLGEGAESGTVISILVKEGDRVEAGQTVIEMENEKAVAPIPSSVAGTVEKIRVKEGDKLSVGQVILTVVEGQKAAPGTQKPESDQQKGKQSEQPETRQQPEQEEDSSAEVPSGASGLAPATSPAIRKLAREVGIDLTRIRGSERGGRIVLADLRSYIQKLQKLATPAKDPSGKPASAPAPESIDFSKWGEISKKPLSNLRKTISRRMVENWTTIPHVTQFDEADITALTDLRKKYAAAYKGKGAHLTLTTFALKAAAGTLKKHPNFNASLDEAAQEVILKAYYHIGLAVDTDQGLMVPVIRDVDKKSLLDLSKEVGELAEKARARKISLEEMKGGTFTISNQGGIGGAHFTPIVNKPEVAILGLGRGAWKAVVKEGKIEPRLLLPLALSYDHRMIDGGSAARFIVDLVGALENFSEDEVKI